MRRMRKLSIIIMTFVMICMISVTVYANSSPTADFSTDSSDVLVSDADISIADIKKLLDGKRPEDVVGDMTLKGYSTLGVFSITAVDGYDFDKKVTTDIKTAGLTSDMTVRVKLLDVYGTWSDVSCNISNGVVSAVLKSEGQVAVFVLDSVDIDDTEEQVTEQNSEEEGSQDAQEDEKGTGDNNLENKSPKTGDSICLFGFAAVISMAGIYVSIKKLS